MKRITLMLPLVVCMAMAQSVSDPLSHTKWMLSPEKGKAMLTFEKGRFGIKACNSIGGSYRIDGQRIVSKGPAQSTLMGCPSDLQKLDTALTNALTKNKSFRIDGNRLTLTGEDGAEWQFDKQPMPSASAKTKFIYVASTTKDCTGVARMKCLQVRDSKDEPWRLHYGGIIGFEHVPGTEYRLRIKEDRIAKPAADQSSVVWYLDQMIEQNLIDRAAAEAYEAEKRKK